MNPSRRTFLVTGGLGAVALAAGGWLHVRSGGARSGALGADGRTVIAAMVPAFLAGALPDDVTRPRAIAETVDAVEGAVAGLPPATQAELAQLFGLLAFAPARLALAGLATDWPSAPTEAVAATLARWQGSRLSLLRSAYDGLHQLVLAAWYGNPRAWPAIGYPGPPTLG